jgi:tetratricopeptide (TPR) repeat protein
MKSQRMSVDKYLRTFRRERARLLALPEATVRGTTVDLVIRLSLDRLRREKGNGILVIDVCAYLGADSIPRDLLDRVAESMNRHVTAIGWLPALLSYSLVKATTSDITIHTLTQEVARSTHSVRIRKRLVSQAVELVLNWVDDDPDRTRKVAPHLIAVAAHSTSLGMRYPRLAKALSAVSITALVSGERAVATDSAVSALKNLATESDRDAKTAADIILALTATGRYDDAIISARQWIALLETSVDNGPSALSTGYIWSILARALACAGKGAEAVQALRRADLISRANLDEAPLTMMLLMAMTHAYISLPSSSSDC